MATVTKSNARKLPENAFNSIPGGNLSVYRYNFTTNASGVLVASDQTTAVIATNVVRLGVLPAGLELMDFMAVISDAFSGSTVGDIGFAYVDGVDSTAVPQDSDYFMDGVSTASTAVLRKTTVTAPVILPKDAYLIYTNMAGADHASVGVMDIYITGEHHGTP
jgi:hypothetical protein